METRCDRGAYVVPPKRAMDQYEIRMRVKQTTKLESGWYNLRSRGVGCWRLWRLIPSCAGCATARSNSRHFSSNMLLGYPWRPRMSLNIVSFFTSYPNIVPSVSNVPSSSDPHIRKANTTTGLHTIASPSPLTQCRNWHDPTIYAGLREAIGHQTGYTATPYHATILSGN